MSQTQDTLMELLISEGPDGMAQVFTALFNLVSTSTGTARMPDRLNPEKVAQSRLFMFNSLPKVEPLHDLLNRIGMISVLYRARHGMRFVIVVVALAVLYLMLVEVEFRGTAFLASRGGFDREQSWMEEARTIAPSLAEAERQFSPAERLRVWRLGLSLGYASERAAALALLDQQKYDGQQEYDKARSEITSALGTAISNGRLLGLEPVELVPVRTHYDSFDLRERIEADETGLAARVGAQLSPWHKHLFLLGMHLGFDLAVIEISKGSISYPDRLKIGRHATIVGIPPGLWQPLAESPSGLDPNQAMVRYRSALNTLEAYLVRQSEVAGGENTSPVTDQDRP